MSGIVTALKTTHSKYFFAESINNFPFAFVTPLKTKD
jgi:hypothetical protein